MDPYICCLLGICCPPAEQLAKLTAMLMKGDERRSKEEAEKMARHDLALVQRIKYAVRDVLTQ